MDTEQNQATPNNIYLKHRFNSELEASHSQLYDCMNPVLERAAAIADVMETALERGMANDISNLWRAAQAIRFEIMDAQVMLEAYVDGVNARPKASQPDHQNETH